MSKLSWVIVFAVLALSLCQVQDVTQTNLLFIMFDDLRPELSNYGRTHMITPNFDRLAKKSVTFDYAFTHISVCNPARDSILTGLRPDSIGSYNFQDSWNPHLIFPIQLIRSGYNTAGFGKIRHWEGNERTIWSYDSWENDWYGYQGAEWGWMNASTMPDKVKREENFRDYEFTSRAIETLKKMNAEPKYYMLGIGYKLPHIAVHMPHKYFELYKGKSDAWKLSKKELRFPLSVSEVSYRCCADGEFKYMNQEGAVMHNRSVPIGDINNAFTEEAHDEMMMGYNAAISFVDAQLGRILDALDEMKLWSNMTVILSADHGMHNGEKGIWEKWTLFEEALRVPLMISHPASPFQGQHYHEPVESVDIYATVNEILKLPVNRKDTCMRHKCKELQGKSLAPVVLGKALWDKAFSKTARKADTKFHLPKGANVNTMVHLDQNVAISQVIRCAKKADIPSEAIHKQFALHGKGQKDKANAPKIQRRHIWNDCDVNKKDKNSDEISLMGYSMRTPEYRYTAYFHYDRITERPDLETIPYEQELFDHKNETLADFTHREIVNLAYRPLYATTISTLRAKLVKFIKDKVKFGDH